MKTTTNNYCLKNESGYPLCHPSSSPSTEFILRNEGLRVQIPYSLPEGMSGYLFIADASGRDITVVELQEGLNTIEVNTSAYPEGTYYYGFRSNAGNCSVNKMVIIH